MVSATSWRSPVTMTMRVTPALRRSLTARGVSSRISSTSEYAGGTLVTRALKKSLAPISRGCGCGYKCVAAKRNSPAVYDPRQAGARLLLDIGGHRQC